ncbi:MAG: isoprenylcysteine carboxylmethyltransferase family protein [Micropruina sp.]|nr:isoprenylcysteine carboxylmethyltransferase family protein [Micropruina sp.]
MRILPPVWAAGAVAAQVLATRLAGGCRPYPGRTQLSDVVAVGSLALAAAGFLSLVQADTTVHPTHPHLSSSLVTSGVYAFSRNPLYLSFLVGLLAVSLRTGRVRTLVAVPALAAVLTPQVEREEQALAHLFGDEFRDYAARVPRWL